MSYDSVSGMQDYELKTGAGGCINYFHCIFLLSSYLWLLILFIIIKSTLVSFLRSIVSFEKEKSEAQPN